MTRGHDRRRRTQFPAGPDCGGELRVFDAISRGGDPSPDAGDVDVTCTCGSLSPLWSVAAESATGYVDGVIWSAACVEQTTEDRNDTGESVDEQSKYWSRTGERSKGAPC